MEETNNLIKTPGPFFFFFLQWFGNTLSLHWKLARQRLCYGVVQLINIESQLSSLPFSSPSLSVSPLTFVLEESETSLTQLYLSLLAFYYIKAASAQMYRAIWNELIHTESG